MTPEELSAEFVAKANANFPTARRATRLLFTTKETVRPRPVGAGVVLELSQEFFLLTAMHVLEEAAGGKLLTMSPPEFAYLAGPVVGTDVGPLGSDPFDAAVMHLDAKSLTAELVESALSVNQIVPSFPEYRFGVRFGQPSARAGFMSMTSIQTGRDGEGITFGAALDEPAKYAFHVAGVPANRFKTPRFEQILAQWHHWLGQGLSREELTALGHRTGVHVAFRLPYEVRDEKTKIVHRAPKMAGVSGSPIWILPPAGLPSYDGLTGQLVGIVTERRPAKRPTYVLGTCLGAHLRLIKNLAPTLEHELLKNLPA